MCEINVSWANEVCVKEDQSEHKNERSETLSTYYRLPEINNVCCQSMSKDSTVSN